MQEPFATLLQAAVQAPSGDNTQPWKFQVDPTSRTIAFYIDETRDRSPMNAGQTMARISLGAAVENVLQAAQSKGWTVVPETPAGAALFALRVESWAPNERPLDPAILARTTNRRPYTRWQPTEDTLSDLRAQTPDMPGVHTLWLAEPAVLASLAEAIAQTDAIMLCQPAMRDALLQNIRFDAPPNATVAEGIPLGSLELRWADRLGLRLLRYLPYWAAPIAPLGGKFRSTARRLAASSSGLCAIIRRHTSPETDLLVGRAAQRAWLALTRHRLAAQPMMSPVIIDALLRGGSDSTAPQHWAKALRPIYGILPPGSQLGFLLRFGRAAPPSARAGRRPLDSFVVHLGHNQTSAIATGDRPRTTGAAAAAAHRRG